MKIDRAKTILAGNLIGPEELKKISAEGFLYDPYKFGDIPEIPFTEAELIKRKNNCVLILGMPRNRAGDRLTIVALREWFGIDPQKNEPCFYNQDWYLHEKFATDRVLDFKWYCIQKNISKTSRKVPPDEISGKLQKKETFPSAILTVYVFFMNYLANNGNTLWANDFLWCEDLDHNGDRIYTGKYLDPLGYNKNGFNIHRFLSLSNSFGLAACYKS